MKERPILFSGMMVRALLEGRKTQTRRIINTSAPKGYPQFTFGPSLSEKALRKCKPRCRNKYEFIGAPPNIEINLRCPFGLIGDRLWVRETFSVLDADGGPAVCYRATDHADCGPWRPSIFMPRSFCRIILEITDVRIQRVQEISTSDAIDEGTPEEFCPIVMESCERQFKEGPPILGYYAGYEKLWDSLNAKSGYDWKANPWVWAITFKHIES